MLPSGQQEIFFNRVGWARTYLKKAELFIITKTWNICNYQRGKKVLTSNPNRIDNKLLTNYEEFARIWER